VLAATAAALILACYLGYVAATESDGPRKIKASFAASLTFSLWFFLLTLAWFVYDKTRPIFQFDGTIESIQVLSSDSRHYSAYFKVETANGGEVSLHASDRSSLFRVNQRVQVRYRGDSGELIEARFLTKDGQQEGEIQSSLILEQIAGMLAGAFLIWATARKYRRQKRGLLHLSPRT
jgi:hypothetical protein